MSRSTDSKGLKIEFLENQGNQGEIAMFDNVVRLIGFVGSDAELKTTKTQREYAVLSLATTASWKDKNGDGYIRRTEWHKLVAWGNLSTFAATLKKGAHVSVEGELRYREFV